MALLAYGECDPNSKTADGKTALHLAVEVCTYVCIYMHVFIVVIRLLLFAVLLFCIILDSMT